MVQSHKSPKSFAFVVVIFRFAMPAEHKGKLAGEEPHGFGESSSSSGVVIEVNHTASKFVSSKLVLDIALDIIR